MSFRVCRALIGILLISQFLTVAVRADGGPEEKNNFSNNVLLQQLQAKEPFIPEKTEQVSVHKEAIPVLNSQTSEVSSPKKKSDEIISKLMKDIESLKTDMLVSTFTNLSTQKPKTSKVIGSKTYYHFKEGDIYEIRTALDRVTDIELEPGETLTNSPVSGDTVRWKIGIIKSGQGKSQNTHVMVKPLDEDIETNIVLTTDKRTYHLRAVSSDSYMPSIAWHYPEMSFPSSDVTKQKAEELLSISPENLHFDYEIEDENYPWKPIRVFDDGEKTYLQMPPSLKSTEAPALFLLEDSEPILTNYRVLGNYYIVDRLFEKAELRVGTKKKIEITNVSQRKSFFQRIFG